MSEYGTGKTRVPTEQDAVIKIIAAQLKRLPAVEQIQAIELITIFLCCKMGDEPRAIKVSQGMHKHIEEMIRRQFQ
jgi:hypothetical protein